MTRQENTQSIADGLRDILGVLDDFKSNGDISEEDLNNFIRPSQRDVLEQYLRGDTEGNLHETGFFDLATGFGKTRVMTLLLLAYLEKNPEGRVIIAVPNTDLIKQIQSSMQEYNARLNDKKLDIGSFFFKSKDKENQIIITTYASLGNLKDELNEKVDDFGLLLLDEAHHSISERRSEAVKSFGNAATYGMSGTPWYSPDRNVANLLGKVIAQVSVPESIREGDLADCKNILMVSDFKVDLSDVRKSVKGDYIIEEYNEAIRKAAAGNKGPGVAEENWKDVHMHIAREVAKFYQSFADEDVGALNGKRCMINCRSQEEARIQAEELNKLFGKEVAKVWISDTKDETILEGFQKGEFPIICQVGRLGEGFDMPDLEICINYPTASRVLEAQRGGRPIRKSNNIKNKMALVIDIAFAHPDYDNVIEGIHENGQVLYQDVLEVPVVTEKGKERSENSGNSNRNVPAQSSQKLVLNGFHIISDTHELITLQKQAKENEESSFVPEIREGMRTAKSGFEEYHVDSGIMRNILKELYDKKEKFIDENGKEQFLVEEVRSSGNRCYALHEGPNSMKELKRRYPNRFIQTIREGMRTASAGFKEYHLSVRVIGSILEDLYNKKEKFIDENGKERFLVELVKSSGRLCCALHEDPNAMEELKRRYPKYFAQPIREGMRTSHGFLDYHLSHKVMGNILEELYNKKGKFIDEKGVKRPLVEIVKTGAKVTYALHEDSNAMEELKRRYPNYFVQPIREGMRTAKSGFEEYHIKPALLRKVLDELYDKKVTFVDEKGTEHFLVEEVRTKGGVCCALHEDPNALKELKRRCPDLFLKPIRKGMRTANGFEEYCVAPRRIGVLLEELCNKNVKFTDENGKEQPLVEKVKASGNICCALHENPKAIEIFKKYYKERTGNELKKRDPILKSENKVMPLNNALSAPTEPPTIEKNQEAPVAPPNIPHSTPVQPSSSLMKALRDAKGKGD